MKNGEIVLDEAIQGQALSSDNNSTGSKKMYLESYGCQMNFSDSEIVASIMKDQGYSVTDNYKEAELIFVNTCAIRENAETKVRNRLKEYNAIKRKNPGVVIGVLGCMAERLKSKLLEEEKLVDIVAGPDSYRDLPNLLSQVEDGRKAVNVILSKEETYADISPVRLSKNGVTAFISIMRGCDNMCSFCVVPFTRGRERSRDPDTIIDEAQQLYKDGFREVTLLGQNVDSYLWYGGGLKKEFKNLSPDEQLQSVNFAQLLEKVASVNKELRVRFSTSHPKDMTDEVLHMMAKHENICDYIHLPVQSGSSEVLQNMNRGYDREWYLNRIKSIREIIPGCGISSDFITGFCDESEQNHKETLSLMESVKYDFAYMFKYSERPNTQAERKMTDNVDEKSKKERLNEIIQLQQKHSFEANQKHVGNSYKVLIEGTSRKSDAELFGRNSQNNVVVFAKGELKPGDYAEVKIVDCTSATLIGEVL
ncbi:MAG TPA: tRNA (N6-isopentenyl adenosine(37)-C2)-methylthiotransferase MiaB [Flavobacteriales bacterium]|nr:tRNA (N6-isopentenyl adenosine(37)-C2)-methylthiotransferase MiaB [Flavobacteriales bacterium]